MQKNTGVYCWINLKNGKKYVGSSSTSLLGRLRHWLKVLKAGRCHNRYFQRAWNKYGSKLFRFKILERCPPENCLTREQWWIDCYDTSNPSKGYNLSPTAGSTYGMKFGPLADWHKKRVSTAMKGNKNFLGRSHTEESRRKISLALTGKKLSKEHCESMSRAFKGRKLTESTKKKMSAARMGHVVTETTRKKISIGRLGKPLSEDHKKKLSIAKLGKKLSQQTRLRMAIGQRVRRLKEGNSKSKLCCLTQA